jgi:hypothetical protein
MLYHVAQCQTCKTGEELFERWIDRKNWQHDDHAGHDVATWLELR